MDAKYPEQLSRALRYQRLLERHEWLPFIEHHLAERRNSPPPFFPTDHVPPLADMMLEVGDPRGHILQRSLDHPTEKDQLISVYHRGDILNFRRVLADDSTLWAFPLAHRSNAEVPTRVSLVWSPRGERTPIVVSHVAYYSPDEAREVLSQFDGEVAESGQKFLNEHFGHG